MVALALMSLSLLVPPHFWEAKALEPAASYVAHKQVVVACPETNGAWNDWISEVYGAGASAGGSTAPGDDVVHLSYYVCDYLYFQLRQPSKNMSKNLAGSIETLTHEAIHARGEKSEGVADCSAIHEMPRVAVKFFHVKAGKMLRALMGYAWQLHRLQPPAYQTAC